ncbi:hypothetical protein BD779DRAFT_318004 [Infundibulicybe gibba]|nr:hypothetical protein BD779DRAFT_318004 [Infundibulicybe gibba]
MFSHSIVSDGFAGSLAPSSSAQPYFPLSMNRRLPWHRPCHHHISPRIAVYSHYPAIKGDHPLERNSPHTSCYCLMSFFPDAYGFQIYESEFNHIGGDYNRTQNLNFSGDQDIRKRIHSLMEKHIRTDAYHNSGVRREISRCYPGTRETALETISNWIEDPASHCLWLHGTAGAGKSAIAYTVAEQCRLDRTLGASYFFIRGSANKSSSFFPTLAYQLALAVPDLRGPLWAMLCEDPTVLDRSMGEQLDKLIVQPFLKLADRPARTVIVIDGLDECDCIDGASIQGNIVRMILGLERQSLPLLFLISSRPELEIRRVFESSPRSSLADLPLDKTLDSDRDIRHFLVSEFERIYVEMGAPPALELPWPKAEDIETLVWKSSGHFIYAATVIRFVQEDHAHPMNQLDVILQISSAESAGSSVTKGIFAHSIAFQELDNLYLRILRKDRNQVELPKVLRAIMHLSDGCPEAISVEIILGLRPGSVCIMLEDLHSIVEVSGSCDYLQFFHASFNDFLADPKRSQEFYCDANHFNAELACSYMRLIVAFKFSSELDPLGLVLDMAMNNLCDCLKATAGLLSDTLGKFINIVTQESESTLPCLRYVAFDFLLQDVLKVCAVEMTL